MHHWEAQIPEGGAQGAFVEIADGPLGAGKAVLVEDSLQGEVGGVVWAEDPQAFHEGEGSRTRRSTGRKV